MIFEVTGGQWPPIWKMKKTGEANIARELCLKFYQNRIIFRHICPRNTIFITNVSQKIPPLADLQGTHTFNFSLICCLSSSFQFKLWLTFSFSLLNLSLVSLLPFEVSSSVCILSSSLVFLLAKNKITNKLRVYF